MAYYPSIGTPPFIPVPVSIGIPPVLPPISGLPGGGPPVITEPDTGQPLPTPQNIPPVSAPYEQGPFCFGLDTAICANLPETIKIGPSVAQAEIPIREICKALTNVVCGLLVAVILIVVLGIALQGLLQ